jgi:hypothetical protein
MARRRRQGSWPAEGVELDSSGFVKRRSKLPRNAFAGELPASVHGAPIRPVYCRRFAVSPRRRFDSLRLARRQGAHRCRRACSIIIQRRLPSGVLDRLTHRFFDDRNRGADLNPGEHLNHVL